MPLKKVSATPEQQAFIRDNYNKMTNREIGKHLGVSKCVIYNNATVMGLDKKVEIKQSTWEKADGTFCIDGWAKAFNY